MAKRQSIWVSAALALLEELLGLVGKRDAARLDRELRALLERVDAGEKVDADIRRLLYPHARVRDWIERHFSPRRPDWRLAMPERGPLAGSKESAAGGPAISGSILVPVFYGTDRAAGNSTDPVECYGSGRGELSFGVAHVSIPHDHRMGELETPKWWKLEFRPDPEKHVVLMSVEPVDRATWTRRAATTVERSPAKDALLFIHGYNVSFADAARRAAQIAYDLAFAGAPLLYSWPSAGEVLRYRRDENNARWTVPHLTEFLRVATTEIGASAVHVIAHSMGNRPLTESLRTFRPEAPAAALNQVIFAAPDIDAATFQDLAREFHQAARRFTLYASSRDKALAFSKSINEYPRAGDAGPGMVLTDGIDTVDASLVDTTMSGHSYIGDSDSILGDVYDLVREGSPPDDRTFRLRRREREGRPYWQFRPRRA